MIERTLSPELPTPRLKIAPRHAIPEKKKFKSNERSDEDCYQTLSVSRSILRVPCESETLYVCSESGASVNRVVVVVANTMAPLDRDVLPRDVFDGIEMEMDCMVRRVSSVLTPRPTRTMISVNCKQEDVSTTGGRR